MLYILYIFAKNGNMYMYIHHKYLLGRGAGAVRVVQYMPRVK